MRKQYCLFLLFLLNSFTLLAQTNFISDDELLEKLTLFHKANPQDLLFVHTDKAIYTNGEQLWFSAYLVKSLSIDAKEHNVLSMALMREDSRKIYRQDKYAMENGLGFGSFILPDTLPPGNYQVLFSTNLMDKEQKPIAQYVQPITIKTINQVSFDARLSLLDSVPKNGEVKVKVSVEFKEEYSHLSIVPRVSYNVAKGKIRTKKLDRKNSGVLTIPVEELNSANPVLLTSISCKNEVQHLSLKLPEVRQKGVTVRFFPEGGDLVSGLESTIALETRTTADLPIPITGILYRDDQPVDTLSTNSYGIGTFKLQPDRGRRYRFSVKKNDYITADTSYVLPVVLEDGVVINFENGVVDDTLVLNLSAARNRKVKVFIHNFRDGFSSFQMQLQPSSKRKLIALPAVPRGLAAVTVMDEEGRPLAERLFFAHHNQGVKMNVEVAKETYKKREQVSLKFKLKDVIGDNIPGIVSVACVQEGRLDDFKQPDIETYSLLSSDLTDLPFNPAGNRLKDKAYLENTLLVRGWRRYTWQGIMNTAIHSDTSQTIQSLKIKGNALFNGRSLKKAVVLNVLRDGQIDVIETAENGDFDFGRELLLTLFGRKVLVMVDKKYKEGYSVGMLDPYKDINERLVSATELAPTYGFLKTEQSSKEHQMTGFDNAVVLKEVVVKGRSGDLIFNQTSNPCGDFVCMYNNLNCVNHFGHYKNRVPVKGKQYGDGITYFGCVVYEEKLLSQVDGIYTSREFYGVDPKLFDFPDPQLLSTLYWKPGLVINKDGEAECTFYSGDIAGKFRVVVQGIGSNELIYGEESFEVK